MSLSQTTVSRRNLLKTGTAALAMAGLPDPHADELSPEESGIFRVDLETGKQELIVSLAKVAGVPYPIADLSEKKHYFNHLLVNPDGTRFEFLHRWAPRDKCDCRTRMLTAALDGSDMWVVDHSGCTSHKLKSEPYSCIATLAERISRPVFHAE